MPTPPPSIAAGPLDCRPLPPLRTTAMRSGRSAFAVVIPRNASAPPSATVASNAGRSPPLPLLTLLRQRCARDGAPAAIAYCLRRAEGMQADQRAVLLQRLSLALADDRRPASPVNALCDARSDAVLSYQLRRPAAPAGYAAYRTSLAALYRAITENGIVSPGIYGFLQQSTACAAVLATARTADAIRQALSGWLQWQWAAVAAFETDPLMRSRPDDHPLAALRMGYALNEPTAINAAVLAALDPPAATAAAVPPPSTAQRDQ